MLDIGWSELLLIGVVALIVVGPKDLPVMFRTLGRFTARARSMARDFQRAMDDAAKSTGVHDVARDMRDMTSKKSLGLSALENAAEKFENWNPLQPEAKPAPASPSPVLAGAASADNSISPAPASVPGPATKALAQKVARERQARLAKLDGEKPAETAANGAKSVAPAKAVAAPKARAANAGTKRTEAESPTPAAPKRARTAAPQAARPAEPAAAVAQAKIRAPRRTKMVAAETSIIAAPDVAGVETAAPRAARKPKAKKSDT